MDVGTEELGHLEIIGAIVHQLTKNLTEEQIKANGFDAYFVDHTAGVYPTAASGFPWSAASMQVKGDLIADLTEDLAADAAIASTQHERKRAFLLPFAESRNARYIRSNLRFSLEKP